MAILFLLSFITLIILIIISFIYKVIWTPFHIQNMMRSQGIKGPSYKIIHGTTKESMSLNIEARKNNPTDYLSHDIFPIVQPVFYTWMKLYGSNFLTWNGTQPHVVITEPELIKEIMTINKEGFVQKIKPEAQIKMLFGDGLVMTEGEKWVKLRKIANHAFYAESLKEMVPAMVASVESMLENWGQYDRKEIEVSKEFRMMSSEVISRTAFGSSYVEGKNIFDMITKLVMVMFTSAHKTRFFSLSILRSQDDESSKINKSLRDSVMAIVKKREQKVLTGETESFGSDYLGSLLRAHHDPDQKNRISVDNIIDECKTFFLAGHDTTSNLLSWTCFLLAMHTDWQDRARNEVLEVFGQDNPTAEALPKLKIVNMIMNEVLRLYSPSGSLVRKAYKKVRLGNKYEFPSNMEFYIPTLAIHRNPEIWGEDAHLFKPERFAQGIAVATRNNPTAFVPFGFGPRKCVGSNFASNQVKVALSMILKRYKFTLSPNYVHSPLLLIVIQPRLGVQIMLEAL